MPTLASSDTTIEECNRARISVLFDANVLIKALAQRGGPFHDALVALDPPLRLIGSLTLYEVAFAQRGWAPGTLEENQHAVRDWGFTQVRLTQKVAESFERLMDREASRLRAQTTLGDFLLVAWYRALSRPVVLATNNEKDFRPFSIPLVQEFLPQVVP